MISEKDIIEIHQSTKDFTIWYEQSVNSISKYNGHSAAMRMVQFSIVESLDEILIYDINDVEAAKDTMMEVYEAIFTSLKENDYMECVNHFIMKDTLYIDFMAEYRLNRFTKIENTGTYWLKLVDDFYDDPASAVALLDDLIPYISWTYTYVFAYAKQYITDNPGNVEINTSIYRTPNYWELKELEHLLDIYPENCFKSEYRYANREELLYDLVNHGIFLPQAIRITGCIRRGLGLDDEQKKELLRHGMDYIDDMENIMYLPSVANTFVKVFSVNKLI